MSHKATNWALQRRGLKPATKLVLFFLADRHNPDYGCFPSQKTLAEDCEMSLRSVRNHLDILEDLGLLTRMHRKTGSGNYTSDRYVLGFEDCPAAKSASGKKRHEPAAKSAAHHRQNLPPNPVMVNPVIEPVKETPKSVLCNYAGEEAVSSFLEYRRKKKGGALTVTAAKRLSKHLDEINRSGIGSADDALGMAEEKGWASIEPTWYFNIKNNKTNGGHNGNGTNNLTSNRQAENTERLRRIVETAAAGTSTQDWASD